MELRAQSEPVAAWREICAQLRASLGDSVFDIWLAPLQLESLEDGVLRLSAPPSTQAWVNKRYGGLLEQAARETLGTEVAVKLTGKARGSSSATPAATEAKTVGPTGGLNPRYRFDQFIIGDGNRLAHAAALAVAELPGQAYNPLFLHAPPGLGKTHLLHAIGNYVLAFGGGAVVRCTTVEAFTNHFITSLATRSVEAFKRAYRDADVLLIDDVQFLASKAKTEEEFFHTFNALYDNGRQLVLTCDRLPRQLLGVEERLRERFESGLVANIEPPDFATRVAILRKRALLDGIGLAQSEILELIAERVTDNVRALEGCLIRIVAHHSLSGRPLGPELARDVLDGMYPTPAGAAAGSLSEVSVRRIQEVTARTYEISVEELVSPSRAARVAWPRQLAIHLTRELTDEPLQSIGEAFGGRNHATVLHACRRVSERLQRSPEVERELDGLTRELSAPASDRQP